MNALLLSAVPALYIGSALLAVVALFLIAKGGPIKPA